MHLKVGRNARALEGPHNAAGRQAGSWKLFRFLRVFFPFLSFFPPPPPPTFFSFFIFFPFRLSLLLGVAKLERNRLSPDYLDQKDGPSAVSRPSPAALLTLGEGLAPGRGLSPGLIYLGRDTPLFAIRIQQENSSQLGRGRRLCCQTGKGVWGPSRALLPEEQRDPEDPRRHMPVPLQI